MKRIDYILTLTSGLLTVRPERVAQALDEVGQQFSLTELAQPGKVSLGGLLTPTGDTMSFTDWLTTLRQEGVRQVRAFWGGTPNTSLPGHIAAAFVRPSDLLLQVDTATATHTYQLLTSRSPYYAITPAQFVDLINAQSHAPRLWERISEDIEESNAMNHRPPVAPQPIDQFLTSPAGAQLFEALAGQLFREVQVECLLLQTPFQVPEDMQALTIKTEPFLFFGATDEEAAEPVDLYPVGQLTAEQLRTLAGAQPADSRLWERCAEALVPYEYEPISTMTGSQLADSLDTLPPDQLTAVGNTLCRCICHYCQETHTQPVIPPDLTAHLGPDEAEAKQIKARQQLDNDQWFLMGNEHPWELYAYEPVEYPPMPPVDSELARQHFRETLTQVADFAETIQSWFAPIFRLACFLLGDDVPTGSYDDAHLADLLETLQQRDFSESSRSQLEQVFWYGREFAALDWSPIRIQGLWAVSVADVFGGMGSWNDQYVDNAEQYEQYQTLSVALFEHRQTYLAALLSGTPSNKLRYGQTL